MFKINTKDGLTERIDLNNESQAKRLLDLLETDEYQEALTGATILQDVNGRGVQYSVTRPRGFDSVQYELELVHPYGRMKGGERILVAVDDFQLQVTVHKESPSVRIALMKPSRRR